MQLLEDVAQARAEKQRCADTAAAAEVATTALEAKLQAKVFSLRATRGNDASQKQQVGHTIAKAQRTKVHV